MIVLYSIINKVNFRYVNFRVYKIILALAKNAPMSLRMQIRGKNEGVYSMAFSWRWRADCVVDELLDMLESQKYTQSEIGAYFEGAAHVMLLSAGSDSVRYMRERFIARSCVDYA